MNNQRMFLADAFSRLGKLKNIVQQSEKTIV